MAFNANVPLATNTIAADLAAINANWEYVILGDGTAGRVLRRLYIKIEDGTNADTIKTTISSEWNGDTDAATDNIGKSATTGNITLDASGGQLTIEAATLAGNCIAILSTEITYNASTTYITVNGSATNNDIVLLFREAKTAATFDLTAVGGAHTGDVDIKVTYLTSA